VGRPPLGSPPMAEQVLSGRYRIVRHLARGGMAEVYLAHDELLDRPVAVKVLFPELARDESFVERFRREAQSAARLNHPNIVSVYDFGEDQDALYIVMEYVEGQTLRDIIRAGGPMAPAEAIKIAVDVAAGLAVAHAEDIVHRDVKPANVLIAADGEGTAKVADFGIARAVGAGGDLTMPGSVVGTATYLSPEQAQGAVVDQRSDVYSLGMVVYEMLTGEAPFKGDNPLAIAYKQQHEVPPPPSAINPAVPGQLDGIVGRAMSIDPSQRQRSAGEFRAELLAIGHERAGGEPTVAFAPAPETQIFSAAGGPGAAGAGVGAAAAAAAAGAAAARGGGPRGAPVGNGGGGPLGPGATPPDVYRRRRYVVVGLLALLVVAAIGLFVLLQGGGGGTKATTTVPRVVGKSVPDAMTALSQAHLRSQVVEQPRPGAPDVVAEQIPVAGASAARDSVVSLIVPSATTTTTRVLPSTRPSTRPTTTTSLLPATTVPPTTINTQPPTTLPTTTPVTTVAGPPAT
jgi:tRNA A-37 threonylcarbamoyl transferase component Bud32